MSRKYEKVLTNPVQAKLFWYYFWMKVAISRSLLALILILSTAACGTKNLQNERESIENPYIRQLDNLNTRGATGNLLACIYIIKEVDFYPNDPKEFSTNLDLREVLVEIDRRALANATSALRKKIESGDEFDFCQQLGEYDSNYEYIEEVFNMTIKDIEADNFVWKRNLNMTGAGNWIEKPKAQWKEDIGQQYLFVNNVNCLFYVFDENSEDKDLMQRAYQWLSQYAGVHIAGPTWILMDSSYDEKCSGPVTDAFGGNRLN